MYICREGKKCHSFFVFVVIYLLVVAAHFVFHLFWDPPSSISGLTVMNVLSPEKLLSKKEKKKNCIKLQIKICFKTAHELDLNSKLHTMTIVHFLM